MKMTAIDKAGQSTAATSISSSAILGKQIVIVSRNKRQFKCPQFQSRSRSRSRWSLFQIIALMSLVGVIVLFDTDQGEAAPPPSASKRPAATRATSSSANRLKRAATARLDRLWDDAVIPYEIDPIFNDERASLFRSAMRHWENYTCIKFVERNPEEHRNYIVFTKRSCGCCSFVGKRGNGAQAISIGEHCDKFGIVVHELGHVVGFWHEHTRPDRDQHVQIIGKNIMSGQEYNFNKLTKEEVNSLGLAYDYDSILHYATNTFAKDTYLDTILPLHGHLNTEEVTTTSQATNDIPSPANLAPTSSSSSSSPSHHGSLPSSAGATPTSTSTSTGGSVGVVDGGGGVVYSNGTPQTFNNKQQASTPTTQNTSALHSSVTTPHMINDAMNSMAKIEEIKRQIEMDFQSMLQFNSTTVAAAKPFEARSAAQQQSSRASLFYVDGMVKLGQAHQGESENDPSEKRKRIARGVSRVDAVDGQLMLATDNLLAKTRPDIGQRVRLSVGDIAQTNLLYKCPKCGRTIQQLSGMFYSPNYYTVTNSNTNEKQTRQTVDEQHPSRGRHDLCEWRLTVGLGERIMIEIADLDIARMKLDSTSTTSPTEGVRHRVALGMPRDALRALDPQAVLEAQSGSSTQAASNDPMIMADCHSDYLEIRDGYTERAPIIAKLCGQMGALRDVIRPVISTSNRLLVTYRSSGANSASRRGFLAHHETICGGLITLGNANFDPLANIDREIEPISLDHSRASGSSQETLRLTGSSGGSGNNSHDVVGGRTGNGSTADVNQRTLINGTSPNENEVLLSSQTNVRYSNLQAHQPSTTYSNINRSQQHHRTTTATTTADASSSLSPLPAAIQMAPVSYMTAAQPVRADSNQQQQQQQQQQKQQMSNSKMWPVLNSTIIQSPNWPEHYRASRECLWQIKAEENHQVSLRFETFDLEPHDSCAYDYVEIRDGESASSELLGRFCGNRVPSQVLSSGSSMLVKFVSDSDINKGGFLANVQPEIDECRLGTHGCSYKCSNSAIPYRCECPSGLELASDGKNCVPTCGGLRNDSAGQITSPSFPDLYPISTRCVWDIVAPAHHRITLNFTYFDLEGIRTQECDYDFVEVWSKMADGKQIKNGVYCGLNQPFSVTSVANMLRVKFNSDNSIQKSGFEADYFIDRDECTTNNGGCQHVCRNTIGSYQCLCNNGFILHENKHDCVGSQYLQTITGPDGTFHSPNFPETYQPNKEYAWTFSTAPGHRIKLVFDQFDLESHQECAYDYVAVFDGEGVDDHALGRFCGSRKPLTLVSSFNMLYLVFHSDATNEKRGFNASHTTICGGRLQAYTNHLGVIYSHPQFNGSSHYGRNEDCDWIIEANENQRIRIEFTFFALEADPNCNYDQTIVYDGPDDSSNQLARLCGIDVPKEQLRMTSSGESILIVFKSDDSVNGKGFSLTYTAIEIDDEEALTLPYVTNAKPMHVATT